MLSLFCVWRLLPVPPGAHEIEGVTPAAIVAAIAGAVALAATFLLAGHAERVGRFEQMLARVLPARAAMAQIWEIQSVDRVADLHATLSGAGR